MVFRYLEALSQGGRLFIAQAIIDGHGIVLHHTHMTICIENYGKLNTLHFYINSFK